MVSIITKFLGPTNTRGARIKAHRADDPRVAVTVSYDYAGSSEFRHRLAATQLADRYGWLDAGTVLVAGGTDRGYTFVLVNERTLVQSRIDQLQAQEHNTISGRE